MKSLSLKLGVILMGLAIFGYAEVCKAQCAWVLWEEDVVTDYSTLQKSIEWHLILAFPKFEHCLDAQTELFKAEKLKWEQVQEKRKLEFSKSDLNVVNKWVTVYFEYENGGKNTTRREEIFKCFPDTIDPRK